MNEEARKTTDPGISLMARSPNTPGPTAKVSIDESRVKWLSRPSRCFHIEVSLVILGYQYSLRFLPLWGNHRLKYLYQILAKLQLNSSKYGDFWLTVIAANTTYSSSAISPT